MPDEENSNCAPNKRKTITWTPNAFLNSLGHEWGFSTNAGFSRDGDQKKCAVLVFQKQILGMRACNVAIMRIALRNREYRRMFMLFISNAERGQICIKLRFGIVHDRNTISR